MERAFLADEIVEQLKSWLEMATQHRNKIHTETEGAKAHDGFVGETFFGSEERQRKNRSEADVDLLTDSLNEAKRLRDALRAASIQKAK